MAVSPVVCSAGCTEQKERIRPHKCLCFTGSVKYGQFFLQKPSTFFLDCEQKLLERHLVKEDANF